MISCQVLRMAFAVFSRRCGRHFSFRNAAQRCISNVSNFEVLRTSSRKSLLELQSTRRLESDHANVAHSRALSRNHRAHRWQSVGNLQQYSSEAGLRCGSGEPLRPLRPPDREITSLRAAKLRPEFRRREFRPCPLLRLHDRRLLATLPHCFESIAQAMRTRCWLSQR